MAFSYYDMVKASTATTGTGSITVGSAVSPYRAFSGVVADGATLRYLIFDASGAWERGYGTYTSSTGVLTRNLECSSTGSLISLSGSATVENVAGAADFAAGPAFHAYPSANMSHPINSMSKVSLNTELYDTDGCYDTSTSKFTPNVAGYYQFNFEAGFTAIIYTNALPTLYKNGVEVARGTQVTGGVYAVGGSALIYCNGSTDYIEFYLFQGYLNPATIAGATTYTTFLSGFLARRA